MSEELGLHIPDSAIRKVFHEKERRWLFSVVDTVALVTKSSDPRNYWKVLKSRLHKTNSELVTKCNQVKLPSRDGKNYLTDTAESDTILAIVKNINEDFVAPLLSYFEKIELSSPHTQEAFLDNFDTEIETIELPVDLYEVEAFFFLEALVAGTAPEDLTISVTYKEVLIKGKRVSPQKNENYLFEEMYWGNFSRKIELPSEVEIDKTEATLSHGVLIVRLQKINTGRKKIVRPKII